MPTEIAPQPPVAAPAAVTPPPAAPAPAATPERPINSATGKPISEAAHNLFKMLQESGDPMREEKPEPKPEPKKEPEPTTPAATTEPEKPIKVSKKAAPKRPDLPIPAAEPAAPVQPATPAASVAVDPKWKDSLNDEEKAALEDAELAETVDPRFKGLSEKMGKFFRDQQKYLADNPDADENDPGYKKLLASAPKLSSADKRQIAEARIERRVEQKYKPELENIQHEIYVRDEEPKIEGEAMQIRKHMAFNALPKEMLTVLKEKGLPALQKEYADELEVAGNLINTLTDDAKELLRITRINPKTQRALGQAADAPNHPKWEQHNRIATMVNEVCNDFQKNAPQNEQVRDGKWFVTREEWARLPANARHQFWTFTNSEDHVREMINRAMSWMPGAIEMKIKERQDALKARGYVRQRAEVAPAAPATPPVASAAPASPRPSPAPAPSTTPAGQRTPGQLLAARLAGEG